MAEQHDRDDDLLSKAIPIPEGEMDDESEEELQPIDLEGADDETRDPDEASSKIRVFGRAQRHEEVWNRKPNITGTGAIHVKTFVAKLRLDAMESIDEQINTWLDSHPEYEVKFVSTTTGELKGKITEPALFVNVWV